MKIQTAVPALSKKFYASLCLILIAFCGCKSAKQVAQSAPIAAPPLVFDLRAHGAPFKCWDVINQCYISTSSVPTNQRQPAYQFSFVVSYHVLNTLTLEENGLPVTKTESSAPPADKTFYFQGELTNLAQGSGESVISFFPKQFPQSQTSGQKSVIRVIETSTNSQTRGTAREKAFSEIQVTYVDPDRCQIQDFRANPSQTTTGNDISVEWQAVNCKRIEVYRMFSPASGGVLGGQSYPPTPEYGRTEAEMEANINGSRTFRAVAAGTESYKLIAYNALGQTTQRVVTARITQPASSGSGSPGSTASPTPCNAQSFAMCITCPAAPQSDVSRLACSEATAKSQLEQENPGCTVTTGGAQQFTFCMKCPNSEQRTINFMGCTEQGARANGQSVYPSCQFTSGACR